MCARSETIVLIKECLRGKVDLGAIEEERSPVVDLDCVVARGRPNGPIDLHVSTCLIVRETNLHEPAERNHPENCWLAE
jgi:hypothetical protein